MSRDKKVLYAVALLVTAVLLLALFVPVGSSKILAACLLLPITVLTCAMIRKRGSHSISKREVLLLTGVVGALYVILTHMTGIFFGYYGNPYFVTLGTLLTTVLPLTVVIVTAEITRSVFLAQKNKIVAVLAYVSCVCVDILMFSGLQGIGSINRFMDLVGLTLFPALTANLLYHYVSKNFGALPNIVYRLITTLYIYFLPTVSGMSDALSSGIKLLLPIGLLALLNVLYDKKKKRSPRKGNGKLSVVGVLLVTVLLSSLLMLVSCQFRFGALVIATESMTGEINKGDMILFERYKDQAIEEGQVVVFQKQEVKIVHRVIQVEQINGETRYYTKGDANPSPDAGYITGADIVGLTDMKVAYVGYPTLWLRELIQN